ncbi:MAG: hypothetical protein ABIK68_10915 [bacterium]
MKKSESARSSLVAVFPTFETFTRFCSNSENLPIVRSFIDYAVKNGIIETADETSLGQFIHQHALTAEELIIANHLSFEELLEKKKGLLNFNQSVRALTNRINSLVEECNIDLPKVTNSMLTRLKKEPADTPHKQNVLRTLAFWMGHERANLGGNWNFETLIKLCGEHKQVVNYKDGVRIGFALYGRGDVIGHEIVSWLKKELKQYIEQSINRFLYGRWAKVRSHDITTLYVDFPKEEAVSNPASYRQCLRSAISLAHQIAIKWALSAYYTKNRFLSIGIAAGDYLVLDNYLLPILNANLPGDPVIRLTDYTRQCILINDIRVILCRRPSETTLFNGETLPIWWIMGLWSTIYFDFVQELLTDKILQNNPAAKATLTRLVWYPEEAEPVDSPNHQPNAVTTFFKFPHNSLLGIELAKTLYYRRRFWEALEILGIVLSIYPQHLNARTLRMVIYRNLALEAPSLPVAEDLFKQAQQEARYIKENCAFQVEDFYCEYAVLYLAKSMCLLKYTRHNKDLIHKPASLERLKNRILQTLNRAEALLVMGMSVSYSSVRSVYLLNSVKILNAVLKHDETIFSDPDKPIDAPPDVVRRPCRDLQWQIGYSRDSFSKAEQINFLEKMFMRSFTSYDDSVSLQAYRPTSYFCTAVSLWDFFPVRTVSVVKRALNLLNVAQSMARSMEKIDVCIYSYTRSYGEMMPAGEFIQHVEKSMAMIHRFTGDDLSKRKDNDIFEPEATLSSMLLTLNS